VVDRRAQKKKNMDRVYFVMWINCVCMDNGEFKVDRPKDRYFDFSSLFLLRSKDVNSERFAEWACHAWHMISRNLTCHMKDGT
jgi:hypothetical protein